MPNNKPSAQEIAAAIDTLERAGMMGMVAGYTIRYEERPYDRRKKRWASGKVDFKSYEKELAQRWFNDATSFTENYRNVRLYRCRVVEELVEVTT